ncbi:MAG: hypothetical protein GXP27_21295 [Planctomycetes bacterium]|nr:hypothetical protein [Planctomycetota bacterium]
MYREQRTMWWSWAILVGTVLGTGGLGWAVLAILQKGKPVPTGAIVALAASAIGMLIAWWAVFCFMRYFIELDRGWLSFGFSHWSVTLPLTELVHAERYQGSLLRFGGLGWRLGPGRQVAYLADFGPAVTLKTSTGRIYVISCQDPDALLAELASRGVATA